MVTLIRSSLVHRQIYLNKWINKKRTKEIVTEAIQAYAENDGYWLKLHQFANDIDISILNKLEAEHRKEWEL